LKAHRLLYHPTLDSRVIKKKKREMPLFSPQIRRVRTEKPGHQLKNYRSTRQSDWSPNPLESNREKRDLVMLEQLLQLLRRVSGVRLRV